MIDNPYKYACSECAGNNEITRGVFAEEKERKTCGYCRKGQLCIGLESLADAVDDNYRYNYEPCDGDGSRPSEIISELLELDQSAGKLDADLVSILHDRELHGRNKGVDPIYDEGITYCSLSEEYPPINDGREHKEFWDMYCEQIKHRTRYFNSKVIKWLNDIFLDLNKIIYQDNISPIRAMGPTDSDAFFYRARHASSAQERIKICCHPTQELNSPPVAIASGGRMNPIGISVFYAAFDPETCISELRLPVGEYAISGQFKLEQPITILDLSVLDKIDPENKINKNAQDVSGRDDADSYEDRLAFLRKFSAEISKPISPHKEPLDYMPTQAFAEYLANHYEPKIDAIIYSSTQTNGKGKNIVFLNRKGKVINIQSPECGQYKALWGDNKYCISPCRKTGRFEYSPSWDEYEHITFSESYECDEDKHLSFVEGSLKLHKILGIKYDVQCVDVAVENSTNS